jgi:3-oxoacid CoA-transferase subunit B
MEVAANGDLANWTIPGKMVKGMGGAMDLVARVPHRGGDGPLRQIGRSQDPACMQPAADRQGVVDLIITDLAVIAVDKKAGGLTLVECAPNVTPEVIAKTGAPLRCWHEPSLYLRRHPHAHWPPERQPRPPCR